MLFRPILDKMRLLKGSLATPQTNCSCSRSSAALALLPPHTTTTSHSPRLNELSCSPHGRRRTIFQGEPGRVG